MEYIITNLANLDLLYYEEQSFINANKSQNITPQRMSKNQPHAFSSIKKKNLLSASMMKGFQLMNQPEDNYEYFSYF